MLSSLISTVFVLWSWLESRILSWFGSILHDSDCFHE